MMLNIIACSLNLSAVMSLRRGRLNTMGEGTLLQPEAEAKLGENL